MDLGKIRIGPATVDFRASLITDANGVGLQIEPKVMQVLSELAKQQGQVVSRASLIDSVWGKSHGADEGLTRAVSLLRKALGDALKTKRYIKTVPTRGYCLETALIGVSDCLNSTTSELSISRSEILSQAPALSLAVLPFMDMTRNKDFDYLCDGMSEELINKLTQLSNLKVSGRTSSFSFKGKNQDIREISEALSVAYVLEGSLRKEGSHLCITVQLIEGNTGFHVFSNAYKGEDCELFHFQERVADLVADEVSKTLNIRPLESQSRPQKINADAYQLFLRGKQLTHRLNGQTTIPTGIDFLQRAVELDPKFAEAWSWLGLAHFILPEFSNTEHWAKHIETSQLAIEQALKINPDSSVAWLVKALHLTRKLEFDSALESYERALILDPNNVETMAGMGLGLMAIGLHRKARPYFERVIENDPLGPIWHTTYAGILIMGGEFEAAERSFLHSFELGFGAAAFGASHLIAARGEVSTAIAFMHENYDALGPVEAAELQSPLARRLVLNAYLKQAPFAKMIVSFALARRLRNMSAQPNSASLISFFLMDKPRLFLRSILSKPNPYLGYTVSRIWEPTQASKNVRQHLDFIEFIKQTKLVSAWQKYGWPEQIKPDNDDNLSATFTVIE